MPAELRDWRVTTYDEDERTIDTWTIRNRTEFEARDEAEATIGDCADWTMTPVTKENLSMSTDRPTGQELTARGQDHAVEVIDWITDILEKPSGVHDTDYTGICTAVHHVAEGVYVRGPECSLYERTLAMAKHLYFISVALGKAAGKLREAAASIDDRSSVELLTEALLATGQSDVPCEFGPDCDPGHRCVPCMARVALAKHAEEVEHAQ